LNENKLDFDEKDFERLILMKKTLKGCGSRLRYSKVEIV
jgi:hypothetical protein